MVVVAVPWSNSLCSTTAPPRPSRRRRSPPTSSACVVVSSSTCRFGTRYSPERRRSSTCTSSHAPYTVNTGTCSVRACVSSLGNSESTASPFATTPWRSASPPCVSSRSERSLGVSSGEYCTTWRSTRSLRRGSESLAKKPKSPVCTIAFALHSAAIWFSRRTLPRMSDTNAIRPCGPCTTCTLPARPAAAAGAPCASAPGAASARGAPGAPRTVFTFLFAPYERG